ncbi:MAG: 3-phosphoshikimate 1-carboxyvinyltransferase [Clostridiales bacterium]|nr:3-phosphoshikimate 1-carboxyvinyltransferase [Clostridiales bacterium]
MDMTFFPAPLTGTVAAPASKSEAHRRMICAGLTRGTTTLSGFMDSADMAATARCLKALGATIGQSGDCLTVTGYDRKIARLPVLDCGESGSTLRFFVPIALAMAGGGVFRMHGRLGQRPMDVYRDLFVPRGVRWRMGVGCDGAAELTVQGQLEAGHYVLPGNVSSQFVSGLMFALPLLKEESTLTVAPPVESASYIRMTVEALTQSGVAMEETAAFSWHIPGKQQVQARSGRLSGDYSQAAVLLCAGALGHRLTVTGLEKETTQGDRAVLRHLEALGATVDECASGVTVTADALTGTTLHMADCPDIAPIIALCCQLAAGESRLTGCGRLRLKECDRLAATVEILNLLGGNARAEGDSIVIRGVEKLKGGVTLPDYNDHRMVMLGAVAATVAENPVTVAGVQALNKSWPEFIHVLQSLGGRAE